MDRQNDDRQIGNGAAPWVGVTTEMVECVTTFVVTPIFVVK